MLLLELLLVVLELVLMPMLLMHGARVLSEGRRVMMASKGRLGVIECMEGVGKVILQDGSTHRGDWVSISQHSKSTSTALPMSRGLKSPRARD